MFLPPTQKKELRKEYIIRLSIVGMCVVLVIAISVSVFMLPAYFSVRSQYIIAQSQLDAINTKAVSPETKEIEVQVKAINDISNKFYENLYRLGIVSVVGNITGTVPAGIKIVQFEYTYTASSTVDVRITGRADTRDALVLFKKNIEQKEFVQKIELPVSDLAKSSDLTFQMKVVFK
jgi:hypothetical protein